MERSELTFLLTRTAAAGAKNALAQCDHQPDAITKSQAYRLYGRSDIDQQPHHLSAGGRAVTNVI